MGSMYFVNIICPSPRGRALVAVRKDFVGLQRVGLADAHEDEVVEDAFGPACRQAGGSAMSTISGKFILKMGRKSFADAPPMWKSFIGGMPTMVAGKTAL